MDFLKQLKKMKKLNRRGKLIEKVDEEDAEKKAVVSSLMIKCNKTEEEVLDAFEDFHLKHLDGFISNDEYINSTSTNVCKYWRKRSTFSYLINC